MSTHWELECVDCGRRTDWGQSSSTNHIDALLVSLCETGAIQLMAASAAIFDQFDGTIEWSVSLHRAFSPNDLNIHLPGVFQNCGNHQIWPRNEYGDWAEGARPVIESPPMATERDPADPPKPVPYWQAAAPPVPRPVVEQPQLTTAEIVVGLETRVHDLRSAIADVIGSDMVGRSDIWLRNEMLEYVQRLRLSQPPEQRRTIEQREADAAEENASFEQRANSAVASVELDPRDID